MLRMHGTPSHQIRDLRPGELDGYITEILSGRSRKPSPRATISTFPTYR